MCGSRGLLVCVGIASNVVVGEVGEKGEGAEEGVEFPLEDLQKARAVWTSSISHLCVVCVCVCV